MTTTIVREVVGIEKEAESIISQAKAYTKQLENEYEEEIKAYRKRMSDELNEKIAAFHKNIEETNKSVLQEEEMRLNKSLEAINNIPQDVLTGLVNAIVSRMLNI